MTRWIRPLAATAALGIPLLAGCDRKPLPPDEPARVEPAITAAVPATVPAAVLTPAEEERKIDTKTVSGDKPPDAKMIAAVTPRPLSDAVKKGLTYLAETQQADGGWNQGGGWRTTAGGKGGRVEGKEVADPSDVGNTAFALLAFLRGGHTATAGDYKDVVKKGLAFVCGKVDAADAESLSVTDVQNTQLQSKIGTHVDTFLATLVLTEFQGKAGEYEKAVAAARDKSLGKIAKHQTEKGEFAGNAGWASNLSWGIANKALSRAKQSGAKVDDKLIARATDGLKSQYASQAGGAGSPGGMFGGGFGGGGGPGRPGGRSASEAGGLGVTATAGRSVFEAGIGGSDAGISLYAQSQNSTNLRDLRSAVQGDLSKAQDVLKDGKATKEATDKAEKVVAEAAKLDKLAADGEAKLNTSLKDKAFVSGFGSNGGEEFLSFLNISETLLVKAGKDWEEWDGRMQDGLPKAQDKNGSWSGHHCITGKTFCTSAALLVLLADRTPFPPDVLADARTVKAEKKDEKK